jgi:hypothetical protein
MIGIHNNRTLGQRQLAATIQEDARGALAQLARLARGTLWQRLIQQ